MRFLKSPRLQQAGSFVAILLGFDLLRHFDPSRVTMHLLGIVLVLAFTPFSNRRIARYVQCIVLGVLLADVVFRNPIVGPLRATDSSPWRFILGLAYAAIIAMIVVCDHMMSRDKPRLMGRDQVT